MTLDAATTSLTGDSTEAALGPPRSLYRQALHDAVGRWGARIGLAWIGLVAFVGIFAPFIANSYPILLKQNDRWSSPLLARLTWVDVTLVALVFSGLILLLFKHLPPVKRWSIWFAVGFGVGLPAFFLVHPSDIDLFSKYREDRSADLTLRVIHTIIPYSPSDRFLDVRGSTIQNLTPSWDHPFGTSPNREDVLSRMIHASRIAVSIGFISTGISLVIGVFIGAIMGYFAGKVDMIGMRLIEIFESIPTLFLLITLVAFYGRGLYLMMVIIGLTSWTGKARFVRAEFLRLRKQDFVQAAVALGLPLRSILFRHMLPNALTPLLISVSFGVASAILSEATLTFLGLGLVDSPSWGQMLDQARGVGTEFHWWMAAFPGGAIFVTVFAYNLIGESLRDALDPKLRKRD